VRRFELGCERETALEGLSDHLLALRAVLEGQGPVGASLPMRAAALVAGGSVDRLGVRERIEAALELERSLVAGAPAEGAPAEDATELAGWVEESVRRMLREAALGELGADLGEVADETLIATGLASGDFEIAVTAVGASDEVADGADQGPQGIGARPAAPGREAEEAVDESSPPPGPGHGLTIPGPGEGPATHLESPSEEEHMQDEDTRILEPVPAEDEIRITARDWLEEVEVPEEAGTLEWPAGGSDVEHRERIDTPRVRHLFPVPEDADWEVRELQYDHYDRRAG